MKENCTFVKGNCQLHISFLNSKLFSHPAPFPSVFNHLSSTDVPVIPGAVKTAISNIRNLPHILAFASASSVPVSVARGGWDLVFDNGQTKQHQHRQLLVNLLQESCSLLFPLYILFEVQQ